jgi:hypothetical protein
VKLRNWFLHKLNDQMEKEKEAMEKAQSSSKR